MKYCFHCKGYLSDEYIYLDGRIVEHFDCLDRISRKLGISERELEKYVIYYCPECETVYLVDFRNRLIRWLDWSEEASPK